MKKIATSLVCILALTIGLQAEQPKEMKPHKGSAELEKIKSLVGTWVGEMKHGDKTMPTSVSYKLTGGGSAVVETWNEGTPMEMVSVYHDTKGKLSMTHYCMLGNQPRLRLDRKHEGDGISMVLVKNSIADPEKEQHMCALKLTWNDNGSIVQAWTMIQDGKPMSHPIELTRK